VPFCKLSVHAFFHFLALGYELRASCLLSRWSTTGATSPVIFTLGVFQFGSPVYDWVGLTCDPPIYAFRKGGMTPPQPDLLVKVGIFQVFCLAWPQTLIL
jgi:hypothetical protein